MDARDIKVLETVPASRKLGRDEAQELANDAKRLVAAKGRKLSDLKPGNPADDDAVDAMLGPTGNLRAPTLRVGKTLLVGFNEEIYEEIFG